MAEVEHGARGWHGINKIPTHINWAALQIGVGKAAIALHAVVFVLGSRVPLLLRDAATQGCRVRRQTVHVLLWFGKRRGRGRVIAEAAHVLELTRVSNVIWATQRWAPIRGVSQGRVRDPFRLLVLFVFHPPVLKPDLYLALGEIQQICHFHSSRATKIPVKVKLLLQLHKLRTSVSSSDPFGCWSRWALFITHLTCGCAVVAFLFGVLPGLLHPGEDLLGDDWCGSTGSAVGWGLLLLGCGAVGSGGGCGQWGCLLLPNTGRLAAAVALTAALTHAISVQVTVFESWWPDSGGLDGTD